MKAKDRCQIYEFEYTGKDLLESGVERWCPLFGETPFIFKPEKYVVADRCLDIISGARRNICEVPIFFDKNGIQVFTDQLDLKNRNWPELEEVPDYPPAFILAARSTALWNNYNITTNAGGYLANIYGHEEWHDNDKGIFHYARSYMHYGFEYPKGVEGELCPLLSYPPGSREEAELIKYEHNIEIQEQAQEVPDYLIFAALAIAEAWGILERVLYYGEREKNNDIQSDLLIANKLLEKAYRLKLEAAKKDKEEAGKDIDALVKYNESVKKDKDQREEIENTRIANIRKHWTKNEHIKQAYIEEAAQIKDNNGEMKPYSIIAYIQRRIAIGKVKKKLVGRKDSVDTIRRYIAPLFPIAAKTPSKKHPQT